MTNASHDWGQVHDLALIYLALMHGADAEITADEKTVMAERLKHWSPEPDEERLDSILEQVMLMYVSRSSQDMLDTAVASVREHFSKNERIGVLNDLADIANADGVLYEGEIHFIQRLARYWEVEQDLMRGQSHHDRP